MSEIKQNNKNKAVRTHTKKSLKIKIHTYRTKQANKIVLSLEQKFYGKNNSLYEGAQLYNKVPRHVKEQKSIYALKIVKETYLIC